MTNGKWTLGAAALALAAAAACGPKSQTAANPPAPGAFDTTCVLGLDGANCTFRNYGGTAGTHCVKVLYGARAKGTVIASDEVCSGELKPGAVYSVAVRFPRRPGDVCGPNVIDCETRVVPPQAAADVALAWADELKGSQPGGGGSGPLSRKECEDLARKVIDVYIDEYEGGNAQSRQYYIDEYLDSMADQCMAQITREQYECVMKGRTMADVQGCGI